MFFCGPKFVILVFAFPCRRDLWFLFFFHAAFCTRMLNSHQGRNCGNPRSHVTVASRSLFHHTCLITRNSSKSAKQLKKTVPNTLFINIKGGSGISATTAQTASAAPTAQTPASTTRHTSVAMAAAATTATTTATTALLQQGHWLQRQERQQQQLQQMLQRQQRQQQQQREWQQRQ